MNATAFLLLTLAGSAAVCDWLAVAAGSRRPEYLLKPLTLIALLGVALTLDPSSDGARAFVVVALVCSLVGDVALMLPGDHFVPGLAAFLTAHVAYVVALTILGLSPGRLLVGVALVVVAGAVLGRRILGGAARQDPALVNPVSGYLAVISLMVVTAMGTEIAFAVVGALLFYVSDGVLGWTRFVADFPRSRVVVMVTYHLGQAGLVLALI